VLLPDGGLARATLADIVFNDRKALADLDRITHPVVVAEIRRRIGIADTPVVTVEAIKLTQSGLLEDVDSLWLVSADPETRVSRVAERSNIPREVARSRVDAASDPLPVGVHPDVTIENSGDWSATRHAIHTAWRSLPGSICDSSDGSEQEELR
jgi:dephospho-CoA kinase